MTKPTQAQIEAARLAIAREQKCSLPCACGRNPQPHLHDCATLAKAAITAAAEVGKQRAERLRLELEKIAWMDEFLDADGAKAMMNIAREAINNDN